MYHRLPPKGMHSGHVRCRTEWCIVTYDA